MIDYFLIKNATIEDVYYYYDRPLLYLVKDKNEDKYLALWVEDTDEGEIFFYTKLTDNEFVNLLKNKVSIFNLFKNSTLTQVFKVIMDSNSIHIKKIDPNNIDITSLPAADQYLDIQ